MFRKPADVTQFDMTPLTQSLLSAGSSAKKFTQIQSAQWMFDYSHTLGNMHSSSRSDRMPTDFGGRASMRSTHCWLSSNSTSVQSTPSAAYTSCSSLNRCLQHGHSLFEMTQLCAEAGEDCTACCKLSLCACNYRSVAMQQLCSWHACASHSPYMAVLAVTDVVDMHMRSSWYSTSS